MLTPATGREAWHQHRPLIPTASLFAKRVKVGFWTSRAATRNALMADDFDPKPAVERPAL